MNSPTTPVVKAFCVGQAKSGTASLFGLLAGNHRAAHEPDRPATLEMILRESRGQVSAPEFRDWLRARDRQLNLEYDIAWANQFMIGHLLATFPDARFIVLVRDAYTWLDSVAGHLSSRDIPAEVRAFLDWWFQPERYPHTAADAALKEHGFYSATAFLQAWNRHVTTCTESIPAERRLILRTHELARSHQRIAEFLQIPVEGFDTGRGHINRGTGTLKASSMITREDLNALVRSICGANMARYFPEVAGAQDVGKLWNSA